MPLDLLLSVVGTESSGQGQRPHLCTAGALCFLPPHLLQQNYQEFV